MAEDGGGRPRRRGKLAVSRLTLTIVSANLIGLVILLLGSFGLTQYRDGLVEAKLEGVRAQAQIIADVLAEVHVAIHEDACTIAFDDRTAEDGEASPICPLSFSSDEVREVFNRVWDSFEGRVRIYNVPATIEELPILDASQLLMEDVVLREDNIVAEPLPPIGAPNDAEAVKRLYNEFSIWVSDALPGGFRQEAAQRRIEDELNDALTSSPFADRRGAESVRFNEDGELVASVSVPIRQVQAVYGVVTAEIGGIDDLVTRARLSILPFFGLGCAAAILSSLLLTTAIAQPIRQLALAADKVREGIAAAGRARIPDFSHRKDEIGELSASLKSMTQAIYARIEAIESFAADVSHELKNPLTSVRSATETLEIAKTPEAQAKLMAVIRNDVARMDRLITDISNASRLDAELAREAREAVDLRKLVSDIVDMYGATIKEGEAPVTYDASGAPAYMFGNPSALGQIFRNLIDNARSFSPEDGSVRVSLEIDEDVFRVYVDDDGPGVPPDTIDKIFTRFYTKRPAGAAFGNNSGLGLAISRQIAQSHGGAVWAENRYAAGVALEDEKDATPEGARFIVELPAA
ncbi:MAG: ATP-binding protein [Pseudomonadota bacterium]